MPSRVVRLLLGHIAARHFHFKKMKMIGPVIIMGMLLAGCAAQQSYRDGKELVKTDQVESALVKFQQAIAQDPHNAQYKMAYLQTRDRAAANYLGKADRLTGPENQEDAEKLYQRVLTIDPDNERARTGLRNLEMRQRHVQLLNDATTAFEKNDSVTASTKVGIVLTENPDSEAARALQNAIAAKNVRAPVESLLASAYKKPITIEFKDGTLKQIFEVISRTSGLNFLFDKDVKTDQKSSIFLKNSTIESAVYFMLLTNQLEQQILDANTILVFPNNLPKLKEYQELVVKSFFLANADAKTVAATLKTILKSRDVVADEKLNMVIVRDTPDAIKMAEKLIALQDVAEPEVMLEVEVLEVKRTRLLDLGIQWPDSLSLTPLSSTTGGTLTLRDLRNLNGSTIGAGILPVTIKARKEDTDANILANPRIRARNHEKAKILIGERVPNITTTITSTGFSSESIAYVDVGLKLEVEPTVYLDNDVAIKIALEVSNIVSQIQSKSGSLAYQIGTRTASTVLRLKDGENQVLAGLINDEDRRSANKVPGLGEIPVLGRLFGSASNDAQKTEIVLSITPHIIRNIHRPDAQQAEFFSGTETSFRRRPDTSARPSNAAPDGAMKPSNAPAISSNKAIDSAVNTAANSDANVAAAATDTSNHSAGAPKDAQAANPPDPAVTTQMQLEGPAQSKVGATFPIRVSAQSDQSISSFPLTVGFDSQAMQVVRVIEGDFLKRGGGQTVFTSQVDPRGEIAISASHTGGGSTAGSGTVATIVFRALSPADAAQIQVLSSDPTDADGRTIAATLPAPKPVQVKP